MPRMAAGTTYQSGDAQTGRSMVQRAPQRCLMPARTAPCERVRKVPAWTVTNEGPTGVQAPGLSLAKERGEGSGRWRGKVRGENAVSTFAFASSRRASLM